MDSVAELDGFTCPLDGVALIEASAGTGKTWNICGLYLRQLLEKDLPVSRLLVVTFTRAATAELSARIRARILAALRALEGGAEEDDSFITSLLAAARAAGVNEEKMKRRLRDALASFDEAAIFTIHGFCQRALADASFSAGLPKTFEVNGDDSDLRLDAARDFWRRELTGAGAALADYLLDCGDSPERWAEWLRQAQARPLAKVRWGEETTEDDAASFLGACEELDRAYNEACRLWDGGEAPRKVIVDALNKGGLNRKSYNDESIETASGQWSEWLAMNDVCYKINQNNDKRKLFATVTLEDRKNKGHVPPSHPFFEAAQALLDARGGLDTKLEMARRRLLRRFIEHAGAGLRARKQAERRISYDDILWNVFEAMTRRPWLAAALHERYPVALIDEFQDTDPLQLEIFRGIYANENHANEKRHGKLFLVGDPKQAIYSFRGADLHTYFDARELVDARYTLGFNRRSTPELVAACNRLFSANPRVFMKEGLDFRCVESQKSPQVLEDHSPSGVDAALRLWRIPCEDGMRLSRKKAIARAAEASAAEIARLLAAGRRGEIRIDARSLVPGDLAVLVRSHREGSLVRAALADKGVGSVELSQRSVYASFEAEELEQVLAAIADPSRERLLKTALATVLMGQDAGALAKLAEDDDELVRQFERFNDWHEDWQRRGFASMLWRWMADAQVAARLLVLEDGERRLTNLLHLAELLQREVGRDSPAGVLRALARLRAEGGGGDDALLRLESDRNLVQIVTIHRAKGLQYGIVFCPFLFDGHPPPGQTGPMRLWHDEAGQQVVDWRHMPEDADSIKESLVVECDAETLRLIYVALTRAVHRCVLVVGCYEKGVGRGVSTKESARSLLNWMVAGSGQDAAQWRKSDIAPDKVDSYWRALAEGSEGAITLEDLPFGEGEPLPWGEEKAAFSAPRSPTVPEGWRIGSYSALTSGATHEDAARDHDARTERLASEPAGAPEVPVPEDDFLRFPRGAAAGDCVHAIFESIDFTRPETHVTAIARALAAHPQRAAGAAPLPCMLSNMLADVLAMPLLGNEDVSLRLETVPLTRRLSEFSFYLPLPRLEVGKLDGWLSAHGYSGPRLAARDLTGYLKGYIDLVFEHAGRYWVLDWKTNYLGDTQVAYAPSALEAAMRQHGYHLQHLLYTVALHRHLRHTLPDYDYERHLGGTLYLFVRGVRPDWHVEGVPAGVFRHRVPKAVIESLDALLADERAETGKSR
ncbi:MAG: exodeoxyribonuclease V subunit beta [Betaproteobacteria bacterium]|nr:exodeoxyribonuclease V subunit beta [Betaproteobacteria bacterium]